MSCRGTEVLLIGAGGGGGGSIFGGNKDAGSGGGGSIQVSGYGNVIPGINYTIVIGSGGAGGNSQSGGAEQMVEIHIFILVKGVYFFKQAVVEEDHITLVQVYMGWWNKLSRSCFYPQQSNSNIGAGYGGRGGGNL